MNQFIHDRDFRKLIRTLYIEYGVNYDLSAEFNKLPELVQRSNYVWLTEFETGLILGHYSLKV